MGHLYPLDCRGTLAQLRFPPLLQGHLAHYKLTPQGPFSRTMSLPKDPSVGPYLMPYGGPRRVTTSYGRPTRCRQGQQRPAAAAGAGAVLSLYPQPLWCVGFRFGRMDSFRVQLSSGLTDAPTRCRQGEQRPAAAPGGGGVLSLYLQPAFRHYFSSNAIELIVPP